MYRVVCTVMKYTVGRSIHRLYSYYCNFYSLRSTSEHEVTRAEHSPSIVLETTRDPLEAISRPKMLFALHHCLS